MGADRAVVLEGLFITEAFEKRAEALAWTPWRAGSADS